MNATEFAFNESPDIPAYAGWERLSPSDWVCLLSGAMFRHGLPGEVIDALCRKYAPDIVDAKAIVFYYNTSTSMSPVVTDRDEQGRAINDISIGEYHGRSDYNGGRFLKRFLHIRENGENIEYAGVFATFDSRHKLSALAVYIERCVSTS